jgi:catechol 2,3-dioxygenase-like lactoylglutathione lyase family enzyme
MLVTDRTGLSRDPTALTTIIPEIERALMIGYVTLGTNDLKKSGVFYDKIAAELGAERFMEADNFIAWGKPGGGSGGLIGIHRPFDGKPATVGNGVMVALAAKDKAQVDRIYQLARSLGGADEGPPGHRSEQFYAAYFRDLDGNKLNAYVHG